MAASVGEAGAYFDGALAFFASSCLEVDVTLCQKWQLVNFRVKVFLLSYRCMKHLQV